MAFSLFWVLFFPFLLISDSNYQVPKEDYLTYTEFKQEQAKNTYVLNAPDNWLKLMATDPIIAKYQVTDTAVMSVSQFSGSVGDELSNVNRWRRQLALPPIELDQLSSVLTTRKVADYSVKVIKLNGVQENFLIYWISTISQHFFVKIVSTDPINNDQIEWFVSNQEWGAL